MKTFARRPSAAAKIALAALLTLSFGSTVQAKKTVYSKTQEIDFEAADVDGKAQNPDGAYLAQKRGIDFMPLYQVRASFDESIKESARYVK